MTIYAYCCSKCNRASDEHFKMGEAPQVIKCPYCKGKSEKQIIPSAFTCKGDDLANGGSAVYCPSLARRMPYGKPDPKAYFTSKRKARDAARAKADTGDYELTLD